MPAPTHVTDEQLADTLRSTWGFDTLRPLQREAIDANLARRDSVVVLPTGGGKSLCYQLPPLLHDELTVVVSPLISLMKDQVDSLKVAGYPAAALHSGIDAKESAAIEASLRAGELRLLFVAPERLLTARFLSTLAKVDLRTIAIDEAHCISAWGHDFRPEYRRLAELHEVFPGINLHAFTATATERVREDIVRQLGLHDPTVLVGTFDRPNLTYRILPRARAADQVSEICQRHADEAVIVYCISRKETESLAATLSATGTPAKAYHAGLPTETRRRVQEAFAEERLNVVCATVAFGMGIDRSNVRCVIHAAMPGSVEAYQQETGRAGRDGLDAECVLLYSGSDFMSWKRLITMSAQDAPDPDEQIRMRIGLLSEMQRVCSGARCRHRILSEYFGQTYPNDSCGACDICLGEIATVPDATTIAQKILSCVARVDQRFGAGHVIDILRGSAAERIRSLGHDKLTTYGLLRDVAKPTLSSYVDQLLDQEALIRSDGEYPVLQLGPKARAILTKETDAILFAPPVTSKKKTDRTESWEGVDKDLFESLRTLRREIANEQHRPAHHIFGDYTLREMARVRPSSVPGLLHISGVGNTKLRTFGERFFDIIDSAARERALERDVGIARGAPPPRKRSAAPPPDSDIPAAPPSGTKASAFTMFKNGDSIDAVKEATNRAPSTVVSYLSEYLERHGPLDVTHWVPAPDRDAVLDAAGADLDGPLLPIFKALEERVSYESIRIVLANERAARDKITP